MNVFKTSALNHFWALQQCLQKYQGADSSLNPVDFVLQVRARNRHYFLYPQFLGFVDGRMHYTRQLAETSRGFTGWLPYFNKRWPTATSKAAFKDFCGRNGLRSPAMWRSPAPDMRDFLVKQDNRAFGLGMRGPFAAYDARDAAQAIDAGGFYEKFVRGRIVKATYWDGRLAAVEIKNMRTTQGNGKSTLRELVSQTMHPETPADEWKPLADVAAYQGLSFDSVPEAGRAVLIDFRYASYSLAIDRQNGDIPKDLEGTPLLKQIRECGPVLWQGIPEAQRPATLFTVDAIADDQDQLWLLEMNCNPVCHPNVYSPMLETLFGRPDDLAESATLPVSALPHPSLAVAAATRAGPLMAAPAGTPIADSRPVRVS